MCKVRTIEKMASCLGIALVLIVVQGSPCFAHMQAGSNGGGTPPGDSIESSLVPRQNMAAVALQPFVDKNILAGAVTLVATRNKILDVEAVGFANLRPKTPMRTDAMFWIASMTKPMTVAAVMMLVDEGKIALCDPLEKYLPEFKGQRVLLRRPSAGDDQKVNTEAIRHPITIRELLSHTSGLRFSSKMESGALDVLPLDQAVRSYAREPLLFQPGTEFEYTNEGINTAARIVEVVSGVPYAEFMQRRLFDPLGMKNTTFWPNREQLSHLAKAYKASADKAGLEETVIDQLSYPLDDRKRYAIPAGGLFSTATDVVKFCQMILNGGVYQGKRILSEPSVVKMTSRQTESEISESYGLGWYVDKETFGHPGVYKTNMTIDRQHGVITIFLVQQAGPWRTDEGKTILRRLTDSAQKLAAVYSTNRSGGK